MDKPETERVITPLPKSLVAEIDDYRFTNRIPSRSEAIRQLLRAGLETKAKKPPEPSPAPARRRKAETTPA